MLQRFYGIGIQLDGYTLLNEVDRDYHAQAFGISNQGAFQSLQRPGMNAHPAADCEAAIWFEFLQVQAGTQSFNLEIRQLSRFALGADKRENSGHIEDSHAFAARNIHKQVPGKQWKFDLRLAAIFPAVNAAEQGKKRLHTAVFEMFANPFLMSRTRIDGVPMGRAPGSRK